MQPFELRHDQFSAVDTYASYLKSVYTREKQPLYKWMKVKPKKYIHLTLIEKGNITKQEADQFMKATIHGNIDYFKGPKQVINIGQIAQLSDGSQPKCILVEGAPGMGKSTLAWKLCHEWGKGKLFQQYQLVVLLKLRDETVQAAKNISDLLQYHHHQIQQAAVNVIQKTGGKGVLLLFEGYDELPQKLCTKRSVILDVITGKKLPEATVLITSRPWATELLHRKHEERISQHFKIMGFTKHSIQLYLESVTSNDPHLAGLMKYISCYPCINSLMHIPLYSAIVVEVYRNSSKDKTLIPKTMTDLYFSLVRYLLQCYLSDHDEKWGLCSFSDLPDKIYQQLCGLGRIAYNGILHDQQVIFNDLPEDFETLGLMQCVPELYVGEGAAASYNFLHLTVQEYLAAFHLSKQPVEKQIEHFRKYRKHEKQGRYQRHFEDDQEDDHNQHHFHTVLRFLSGITKFTGYTDEVLNTLCVEVTDEFHSEPKIHIVDESGGDPASVMHEISFSALHWLFETQDIDVISKLLGSFNVQLSAQDTTSFDCFVLGYCVSHSNSAWRIDLFYQDIGDEGVEMLLQGAVEKETHSMGGISEIDLSGNDITSAGVKHLSNFPKQLVKKLETLNLQDNKLNSESCQNLAHLIPHAPHLKKLNLSHNQNIGKEGAVTLLSSLSAHNSLEELLLVDTGIGVEDCKALSKVLAHSSCTHLKELYIGLNILPPEAVEPIISELYHNMTLESLNINNSHFHFKNTISLASVLRTNKTLVLLSLVHCNIDSDGACQLASALCTNGTLQELYLHNNPIGAKEAIEQFSKMLHENKSLKKLDLGDDSIGEEGTQKLIVSLAPNTTVEQLYLPKKYKSSITSSGVESCRVVFW